MRTDGTDLPPTGFDPATAAGGCLALSDNRQTHPMSLVSKHGAPASRIRFMNRAAAPPEGEFVLYWMTASRRLRYNYALQVATAEARARHRPLLVLEALRAGHRWANDRLHRFVLDGMVDNARRLDAAGVQYFPYVESRPGDGSGLLESLAGRACLVVTDDYPGYFLPRMLDAAARRVSVPVVAVDSNGLLPLRSADRVFTAAYHFRRFLQRTLPECLGDRPQADPLRVPLPDTRIMLGDVERRWRPARPDWLKSATAVRDIVIDHDVAPAGQPGGEEAARKALRRFLRTGLSRYADEKNDPDSGAVSGLSPWLHWGHLSVHEVFDALARHEGWSPGRLAERADGKRTGWWGMSASAEAFLDELVTWREVGFNMAWQLPDCDRWETLPDWARATLTDHEADPRPAVYSLERFAAADTHDALWNAAQRELLREGRIHGYLRMLWGKRILEWTESPRDALDVMIELNNRYALDGRDPNSTSGIFWCLGRYDRPWPERAVFGKVRSMTSDSTRRKVRLEEYMRRFAG